MPEVNQSTPESNLAQRLAAAAANTIGDPGVRLFALQMLSEYLDDIARSVSLIAPAAAPENKFD